MNCPFDRDEYEAFVDALLAAQPVRGAHSRDDDARFSKPACRSKNWRGADAIRCASDP